MKATSPRWHEVTESAHPHEQRALDHVRAMLPDRAPWAAWSNFTFVSTDGRHREIDLLVATPNGLHLIEIKNWHGHLTNDGRHWSRGGRPRKSPLDLTVPAGGRWPTPSWRTVPSRARSSAGSGISCSPPWSTSRVEEPPPGHQAGEHRSPRGPDRRPEGHVVRLLGREGAGRRHRVRDARLPRPAPGHGGSMGVRRRRGALRGGRDAARGGER